MQVLGGCGGLDLIDLQVPQEVEGVHPASSRSRQPPMQYQRAVDLLDNHILGCGTNPPPAASRAQGTPSSGAQGASHCLGL
ncbi:hypothetical protein [Streptacidiphilus jeojiense]|uniref:Uncharacterized protein n=1 Tax=Streptacidiphilus cavernicola TaxID=3342716 RepID=A0ABV6V171_9ACTN|nr:hypothetical protein [Streptacidiphilus jeojiense]